MWNRIAHDLVKSLNIVPPDSLGQPQDEALRRAGLLAPEELNPDTQSRGNLTFLDQRWDFDGQAYRFRSNYPELPYLPNAASISGSFFAQVFHSNCP